MEPLLLPPMVCASPLLRVKISYTNASTPSSLGSLHPQESR